MSVSSSLPGLFICYPITCLLHSHDDLLRNQRIIYVTYITGTLSPAYQYSYTAQYGITCSEEQVDDLHHQSKMMHLSLSEPTVSPYIPFHNEVLDDRNGSEWLPQWNPFIKVSRFCPFYFVAPTGHRPGVPQYVIGFSLRVCWR